MSEIGFDLSSQRGGETEMKTVKISSERKSDRYVPSFSSRSMHPTVKICSLNYYFFKKINISKKIILNSIMYILI